jgi:hypothetical protein
VFELAPDRRSFHAWSQIMTQPTAEQLRLARECAVTAAHSARFDDEILSFWTSAWSDMAKGIFEEGATQSALLAIQATEARMAAAVEADVEKVARIIDPSSWAVMDGYLSDMLRKYKGQKIGYDPDAFKDKPSMKIAEKVIAAIRSQSNG